MALSSGIQRGYGGEKGSDFESHSQEDWRWIFRYLSRLHPHPPQRIRVASASRRRDLRLTELIKSTCGESIGDIFPPKVFLAEIAAESNAPRLGSILKSLS